MRPVVVDIYDQIAVGAVSGQSVIKALGPARNAKEILVRMNSPGGDVTEGIAIYNLLLEQRKAGLKVTCRIDGLCASIATVIACAADVIEISENAFFCVHDPMTGGMNGARSAELRERADMLDSMTSVITNIYMARTGLPEAEVRALMEDDQVISAAKALELGFVDKVTTANFKAVASINVARLPQYLATQVPQALRKAKAKMEELEALKAAFAELKAAHDKMAEELAAMRGAKAEDVPAKEDTGEDEGDGEEGEVEAKAAARVTRLAMAITGQKDLSKLEGSLLALSAKVTDVTTSAHEANVKAAIKAGILSPSKKALALKMSPENFGEFLALNGGKQALPVGKEFQVDPTKSAELLEAAPLAKATVTVEPVLTADHLALARQLGSGVKDPVAFAKSIVKAS